MSPKHVMTPNIHDKSTPNLSFTSGFRHLFLNMLEYVKFHYVSRMRTLQIKISGGDVFRLFLYRGMRTQIAPLSTPIWLQVRKTA